MKNSNSYEDIYNKFSSDKYIYSQTITTNTTSTGNQWYTIGTYNYVPYDTNYVYNQAIVWNYSPDIDGLREYMFANNLYNVISDILYDMYCEHICDEQEFEDNLYKNTLDLLYDFTREDIVFKDLLDERLFGYNSLNKIINEIIDSYRHNFLLEEY